LILSCAVRLAGSDGRIDPAFLVDGQNLPRDIILQIRELRAAEKEKAVRSGQGPAIEGKLYAIVRDAAAIKHRIYGLAAEGSLFLREDILARGTDDQVREAIDHEARHLSTGAGHDAIIRDQYPGGLTTLLDAISAEDKALGGINFNQDAFNIETQGDFTDWALPAAPSSENFNRLNFDILSINPLTNTQAAAWF